jgi:transcriptional regulator with XRE-family HTH domain
MARTFSGRLLRQQRTARGLRREQVALAVDRSVYSVAGYETNRIDPPARVVAALAELLDLAESDLFEPTATPSNGRAA